MMLFVKETGKDYLVYGNSSTFCTGQEGTTSMHWLVYDLPHLIWPC